VTLTFALLIAYSILLVGLGLWIGRRVRSGGDFFVAGRGLSPTLIFSTFLAANIGASSTVGASSLGFTQGVSAWWWNGSAAIGTLVLAFWIGPRMWRQAKTHGDLTVGDFLERHYGRPMRGIVALLIWVGTLHIFAAQLLGIAAVLRVVGGVPPVAGYIAGAAVACTYFTAGGLLSAAWVNRVQLVVILAGFALFAPLATMSAGGWEALAADDGARTAFLGGGVFPAWKYLFLLAPAFIVSPGLLQKAFGARDERALRTGLGWTAAVMLVFAGAPMLIGMSARAMFPELPAPDLALPTVVMESVHPAVGSLALAAVFSAELSSADAVLFMLATSASRDIYHGFLRRGAADADVVKVARGAAVGGAVLGIVLAMQYATVIDAVSMFYSLLTVVLFVPVVGALLARRVGPLHGLAAVAAGVSALFVVTGLTGGAGYGVVTPVLAGILAGGAAFVLAGLIQPSGAGQRPTPLDGQ
jgi:solute:Na+ symporter, SSS family